MARVTINVDLGELPGEGDLAFVALDDAWRSVYDALRELDRVE